MVTADELDARLRAAGTVGRAESERRYLRSELVHYGCSVPAARSIARTITFSDRGALLDLVVALWAAPVHERRLLAVILLERHQQLLQPGDIVLVERLLRESRTWALLDELAAKVAGPLLDRHPDRRAILDRWAADGDFWIRRSVLLAHLVALRAGGGDFEGFACYADAMLDEREFFIRKAIGWVLRDTGRRRPELVAAWIEPRVDRASGVTMREVRKVVPAGSISR
jgi:3-methyladenine DNA glycosylase AlkD